MRVGLFTDVYPPYVNGVSTSVLMLKNSLEKLGHKVYVVTVSNTTFKYVYEDYGKVMKIPGLPIGIYDYRLTGVYHFRAMKKIKKWKLDVIHSHTEFGVGTFARIIAHRFDIPLVHTYHTMYEDYIHYITKGYFNGISKNIVKHLSLFYCDKTNTELVVPTKKTYDLFKEKYKLDRNIHIVPTGIEVEKFHQEQFKSADIETLKTELGISKKDFVLLFVGRIAAEKNIKFLLDEQKKLSKIYKNLKLVIVGNGPDFDKHKQQVTGAAYNNSVIFTGKVPLKEVSKYYQLGDVFVTASTSETQGLTVIEAMAASMPVIAIKDESFINVVVDDLNGYLFTNKKQYLEIIKDLYQDNKKLNRLKKQARINSEIYSSKYYGERILKVYQIAIENYKKNQKKTLLYYIKKVVGKIWKK